MKTSKNLPRQIDLVIVNGQGTLHHNYERKRVEQLTSLPLFASERWGCRTALVNSTIYKNDLGFYDKISGYDYISCRDTYSKLLLESKGSNADYYPDLSFFSTVSTAGNYRRGQILVTDSVFSDVTNALIKLARSSDDFKYIPMQPESKYRIENISAFVSSPLNFLGRLYSSRLLKRTLL